MIFATHSQMSEKEYQNAVVRAFLDYGWKVYHTFDSRRSEPGFPDLVMVKGKRIVFVELKSAKGKETTAQLEWLDALDKADTKIVDVWRPESSDGEIIRLLRL